MAKPSIKLIQLLRQTAKSLERSQHYQWGHMGSCNCGFLAQELTRLTRHQIHSRAMQRYGDWNEQLNDYCPTSGLLMDDLITHLLEAGLDIDDLKHLEMLSDPQVLSYLPSGSKHLTRNVKSDVVAYLKAWSVMMEDKMTAALDLKHVLAIKDNTSAPVNAPVEVAD